MAIRVRLASRRQKGNAVRVLVVGQVPPPYHGQAIMIETMLAGCYQNVQLFHILMAFSKETDRVGKFRLKKIFHLVYIILKTFYMRLRHNTDVLYYPPAGPDKIPIYRDIVFLISTRWLFKKVIFHFHAGGISEVYNDLPSITRLFFRLAYFKPDISIRLSKLTPEDGRVLEAKREYIIPHGIKDHCGKCPKRVKELSEFRILFVGALRETKGVLILLKACKLLVDRGFDFRLDLMGEFTSEDFEGTVKELITKLNITTKVKFLGVLTENPKYQVFSEADVLCFPTFFPLETFGIVLLEAMQFCLPIVASNWRSIPSIIQEGYNGFIVPIRDHKSLAEKLEYLIRNPEIAMQMGRNGRTVYLEKYTVDRYYDNLEKVFLSAIEQNND